VNREFKRRMKREEKAQQRAQMRGGTAPPIPVQRQRRERLKMRTYLSEIRSELKRVIWPTRTEVITYSVVVVMVVSILTTVVFLLDLGFAQGFIHLFKPVKP
jgi:preprotein translocase subunit SecE